MHHAITARRRPPGRRRTGLALIAALTLAATAVAPSAVAAGPSTPVLGPNVVVFDPSMPVSEIQAAADAIYTKQVDAEMGTDRYALLFKPGVYGTATQPL